MILLLNLPASQSRHGPAASPQMDGAQPQRPGLQPLLVAVMTVEAEFPPDWKRYALASATS